MFDQAASLPRPVFFLHIPKTGGTSLRGWLANRFAARKVRWLNHHPDARAEEAALPLDSYDLVGGHACYRLVDRFALAPRVIVFLRDPIDRALSAFYYFRQVGPERLARHGAPPGLLRACESCLAEFVTREPQVAQLYLGDVQTWMLSRPRLAILPADAPSPLRACDLEAARANLARCEFVGLTERMDESLELLCRTMAWPSAGRIERANSTEARPACESLDARTLRLLEELTARDRELYALAASLVQRRLKAARCVPGPLRRLLVRPRGRGARVLPGHACLDFGEAIPGDGWLSRESSGDGHFCWMAEEAWVELEVAVRGDMRLRCSALGAVAERQLAAARLAVNGEELATALRLAPPGVVLEAEVPYRVLRRSRAGPVRVSVRVAEVLRPADEVSGSTDSRRLGLAVRRIELLPASEVASQLNRATSA